MDQCKHQYQHAGSPCYSPYISYSTGWENVINHKDILSLMIVSFILVNSVFDKAVIWYGEIAGYLSLRLKIFILTKNSYTSKTKSLFESEAGFL